MIRLKSTVRGIALCATEPDVRYRRYHQLFIAPEETQIGQAVRVYTPDRYSDRGVLLCSASSHWEIDGRYADPSVSVVQRDAQGRSLLRRDYDESTARRCLHLSLLGETIPGSDPEVARLLEELDALDQAWTQAQSQALAYEDETRRQVAHAVASEAISLPGGTALECLECGAVYQRPGSVEPGGMGCRRC